MILNVEYEKLMSAITEVQPVADDSHSDMRVRNIIFELEKSEDGDKCTLLGINGFITFRRPLDMSNAKLTIEDFDTLTNGKVYFQLNSKEFVNFLSSYRGLSKTEASEVIIEFKENRVKVTVIEVEKDKSDKFGAEEGKTYSSFWLFAPITLSNRIMQFIAQEKGDTELTELKVSDILLYTSVALQLILNDPQQKQYSSLFFDENIVFIQSAAFSTVLANAFKDSDIFKNIALFYGVVSFLNKSLMATESETFSCYKGAGFIYIEWDDKCAFVKYDTVIPPFKQMLEGYKLEHYITIDRMQLKDSIRRLLLLETDVTVSLDTETGVVKFDNEKYSQTLDYIDIVDMEELSDKKFRIKPTVLSKAIIGRDDAFNMEDGVINLVYCPQASGSLVFCLSDNSGAWFSYIKVRAN